MRASYRFSLTGGPKLGRRTFLRFTAIGLCQLLSPLSAVGISHDQALTNTVLFNPAAHDLPDKPLLTFRDFVQDFDPEVERRLYQEIADRQDLIERLKRRIDFESRLSMKIDDIKTKLLFVPELREKYVEAYLAYCRRAVAFTCKRLNQPEIYRRIVPLTRPFPNIPTKTVTAYLVHRLIKEYVATCTFTGEGGTPVRYNISGAFVSRQLGAVGLTISCPQPGLFSLKRTPYSIWQNDAASRFNLIAVPIEESLHFILGESTDQHIAAELARGKDLTVFAVQQIADHWIAIEEAIVGGILHQVLEDFIKEYEIPLSPSAFNASLNDKKRLAQYKYRARGVWLVNRLGVEKTFQYYKSDPMMLVSVLTTNQER